MKEIDFLDIVKYVCNDTPWKDDTDIEVIINQANLVFNDITINKTKEKKLYRLCGQTGSGKTTQLLYAMEGYTKSLNLNPVVLGVRCCATYHPNYNNLLELHGQNNIREITNGFALKCMTYLLKLLIENEEQFFKHAAAVKNHHEFVSGLATHVVGMLRIANSICDLYPMLNRDLLVAGILVDVSYSFVDPRIRVGGRK